MIYLNLKDFISKIRQAVREGGSFIAELGKSLDSVGISAGTAVVDKINWQPKWIIEKYPNTAAFKSGKPSEVLTLPGNMLLNEGINELLNLLIGGAAVAFSNANARIGVGDSNTAEAATQEDLQAATNKLYKPMDASYPQVSGQTVTFRATFGPDDANWAWNEITADNGVTAAKNLNRKVQVMGVKANPAIWVVNLAITIS